MNYLIFDPTNNQFWKNLSKTVPDMLNAKIYRRKKAAIERASVLNCSRNIPPGYPGPDHKYQSLLNYQVWEYDDTFVFKGIHIAPPACIIL